MVAQKKFQMPKADGKLWLFLVIVAVIALATLILFGLGWMVIVVVIIGVTFPLYCYDRVPAFHAQATENIEGSLGVWFPGLNFFIPFMVKPTGAPTDLQAEVHLSVTDSYQSKADGVVFVRYVMSIRIDVLGSNPKTAVLKYLSFEKGSIETLGRSIASQLISDWFATNRNVFSIKKEDITEAVFGTHGHHPQKIKDFTDTHGVHFHVNIEDVDPDQAVKKAREAAAQAKSAAEAIKILRKAGYSQQDAERYYRLSTLPNVNETIHTIELDSKGLEKLQNFSILGGLSKK